MNLKGVYAGLEAIIQFMHEKGLVTILDPAQYKDMQLSASRINSVEKEISYYQSQVAVHEAQKGDLTSRLNSKLHILFSGQSTLDREKRELQQTEVRLQTANKGLTDSQAEKQKLEQLTQGLWSFVKTSEGYVLLTDLGIRRAKQISSRMERLGDVPYDDFSQEVDQVYQAISERWKKFKEMYDFLLAKGFSRDSKVVHYALSLIRLEGTKEEIYERAGFINDHLYNEGWKTYDRLRIASLVASMKGDIHELKDELVATYLIMTADSHTKSYSTWSESAAIMRIKVPDGKSKY